MWSPSHRAFRRLLTLGVFLYACSVANAHYDFLPSAEGMPELRRRLSGAGALFNETQWIKASLLLNVGTLASLLGMYLYWDIARWGALIFQAAYVIASPCFGIGVYSPAELFLGSLTSITIDAAIAICFLTPIAQDFTGDQIVPPTIVDDDDL